MYKQTLVIICSVSSLVLLVATLNATPAWSAPRDKKPEIRKTTDKGTKDLGDLKDGRKGKKSVKKKMVKRAGAAAAVGLAGAKVKSGVKGKVKKDKE